MIQRQLLNWLLNQEKHPQVTQVTGLRQTGKTTLMGVLRQKLPASLLYELQDLVTLRRYESQPETWVMEIEQHLARHASAGPLHVFVDEIQKVPVLFQAIQGLYDHHKGRLKFWIWGSSARAVKRHKAETLTGRIVTRHLWPLSQSELLGHQSIVPLLGDPKTFPSAINPQEPRHYLESLKRFLLQTLLPEPQLSDDAAHVIELLTSYQATYLENEIRRENLVDDIGAFENLLRIAAAEDGNIINYSAQAKVLGISPKLAKSYYEILSDTFVSESLSAYSKSLRVQIAKSAKTYFTDTGLARFVAGQRGELFEKTPDFGRYFEGFVINEIRKQCEYHGLPWHLAFLRTKTQREVDLVVQTPRTTFAVEIKSTDHESTDAIKSIQMAMMLDPAIQYGIVISRRGVPVQLAPNIWNVPVWML
jgi:predicted AAA+ superfamily ATPase